jgi:hypothetical protein
MLTPKQVANILGISENKLTRMRNNNEHGPPWILVGREVRYEEAKLREYLSNGEYMRKLLLRHLYEGKQKYRNKLLEVELLGKDTDNVRTMIEAYDALIKEYEEK